MSTDAKSDDQDTAINRAKPRPDREMIAPLPDPEIDDGNSRTLTVKQQRFAESYIRHGNAAAAYREVYGAEGKAANTVYRDAADIIRKKHVAAYISRMRREASQVAQLNRQWVLSRLMRNAEIAMGDRPVKVLDIKRVKDLETGEMVPESVTFEVTMRDAGAANKALELLGKTPEAKVWDDGAIEGEASRLGGIYGDVDSVVRALQAAQARATAVPAQQVIDRTDMANSPARPPKALSRPTGPRGTPSEPPRLARLASYDSLTPPKSSR